MPDERPPAAPDVRLGKGLRMGSVVLASALAAVVAQLVIEAVMGPLDVPAPGNTGPTAPLRPAASMGVGAISAGAALLVAALLLPRANRAIRITQGVGVIVLLLSMVRVAVSWSDLTTPAGLVVLHAVVAIVVLLGLDWAMDDVATANA